MKRLAAAAAAGLMGASLLFAPIAQACEPWDCPNNDPNPGPGGGGWYGPSDWYYGGYYAPGYYGGHYWGGGRWFHRWY